MDFVPFPPLGHGFKRCLARQKKLERVDATVFTRLEDGEQGQKFLYGRTRESPVGEATHFCKVMHGMFSVVVVPRHVVVVEKFKKRVAVFAKSSLVFHSLFGS